jgi:hypothetical protein
MTAVNDSTLTLVIGSVNRRLGVGIGPVAKEIRADVRLSTRGRLPPVGRSRHMLA